MISSRSRAISIGLGGLGLDRRSLDVLLPSFYFGVPVLAHRARKFDPEEAFALIGRHRVRNAFLPPTALKMMRPILSPRERFGLNLRSVASGGEALGEDILAWSNEALGIGVNEFYGQTEANLLVGNCGSLYPVRPGSMGRPIPGHRVAVVSGAGEVLSAGETGIIAVQRPDPVMFLGYWNNPAATAARFAGGWLLTGDVALQDDAGYIWYKGREDDLISSGGYRIGPTDIEDCLMKHTAVLMAAAVGHPDPVRGEIVRAFIVPKTNVAAGPELAEEIRAYVGRRLAWYQAPREGSIRRRIAADRDGQDHPPRTPRPLNRSGGKAVGRTRSNAEGGAHRRAVPRAAADRHPAGGSDAGGSRRGLRDPSRLRGDRAAAARRGRRLQDRADDTDHAEAVRRRRALLRRDLRERGA
jgi:acyl-CoA synthetase (AMP-forming)/AMP-acid ligase II